MGSAQRYTQDGPGHGAEQKSLSFFVAARLQANAKYA